MSSLSAAIAALASDDESARAAGAAEIYRAGRESADAVARAWWSNAELSALLCGGNPQVTVGVAVQPEHFARIHEASGSPRLATVPPDQDAREFELHFGQGVSLDILTTREPLGGGAIARYLETFGEGIQQVEFRCNDVERATEILKRDFGVAAIYPQARAGADGTVVNFFLVSCTASGGKVLIELYQR